MKTLATEKMLHIKAQTLCVGALKVYWKAVMLGLNENSLLWVLFAKVNLFNPLFLFRYLKKIT